MHEFKPKGLHRTAKWSVVQNATNAEAIRERFQPM